MWMSAMGRAEGPYLPTPPCTVAHILRIWTPEFAAQVNKGSTLAPIWCTRSAIFSMLETMSKYVKGIRTCLNDSCYKKLSPKLDSEMDMASSLLHMKSTGFIFTATPISDPDFRNDVGCLTILRPYRPDDLAVDFSYLIPTALLILIPAEFLFEEYCFRPRCLCAVCDLSQQLTWKRFEFSDTAASQLYNLRYLGITD